MGIILELENLKGFISHETCKYFNIPVILNSTGQLVEYYIHRDDPHIKCDEIIKFINQNIYDTHPECITQMFINSHCWEKKFCKYFEKFNMIDINLLQEYEFSLMFYFGKTDKDSLDNIIDIEQFLSHDDVEAKLLLLKNIGKDPKNVSQCFSKCSLDYFLKRVIDYKFYEFVDVVLYDQDYYNYLLESNQIYALKMVLAKSSYFSLGLFKEKIELYKKVFVNLDEIQYELFNLFLPNMNNIRSQDYYLLFDNPNDFQKYISNFLKLFGKNGVVKCFSFEKFIVSILNNHEISFKNKINFVLNNLNIKSPICRNIFDLFCSVVYEEDSTEIKVLRRTINIMKNN